MQKGQLTVRPGDVALTIHEPIDTAQVSKDAVRELAGRVHDIVARGTSATPQVQDPARAPFV
jgi:hypothetical protein